MSARIRASPESVAAVGDSITRGFDACSVLADCPEASWSTGTDSSVRSLAVRLLGASGAATRSWNHAELNQLSSLRRMGRVALGRAGQCKQA